MQAILHHTLAGLREGKRIEDASLMKLFRAAEALRQEADPIAAAMDKALEELRRLRDEVGGRNKLAKLLGVTGPYLGRVLRGDKPMTEELVEKIAQNPQWLFGAGGSPKDTLVGLRTSTTKLPLAYGRRRRQAARRRSRQ